MNIDILSPSNRVHLPLSQRVSALEFFNCKLFVGYLNGDLSVYNIPNKSKAFKVRPSSHLIKSWNSIIESQLMSVKEENQNINLDITFKNITDDASAISYISCFQMFEGDNRNIIVIGKSDKILVYERVGGHLNFISGLEDISYYSDLHTANMKGRNIIIVGNKKKLYVYQLKKKSRNIVQIQKIKEVSFKDKIRSIGSISFERLNYIIVSLANDFVLVGLEDETSILPLVLDETSLTNFSNSTSFSYFGLSNSKNWIINLYQNKVLIVKDNQVAIVNIENRKSTISPSLVRFQVSPLYIAFLHPLYLLTVYNKRFEIIDYETGYVIQRFNHHLNSSHIKVSKNDNCIFLASSTSILQFNILNFQKQIDQYLSISGKDLSFKTAKDPTNDLKYIGLQKALSLVSKLDEADPFFGEGKLDPGKRKQLALRDLYRTKATFLFETYFRFHETLVEICSEWLISYQDVFELFPGFIHSNYLGKDAQNDSNDRALVTNTLKKVTPEDIKALKGTISTDSSTENEHSEHHSVRSSFTGMSRSPASKPQNVKRLMKAVHNLIVYLTDQRRIHSNFRNDPTSKINWKGTTMSIYDIYPDISRTNLEEDLRRMAEDIDTTLFLCYFYTKPMLLGPLLRLPNNHCNATLVNEYLLGNLHDHDGQPVFIKELLDFYYGRNLHEDALQMLYDLSHETHTHNDELDEFLSGPQLTIQYLQRLPNTLLDLIFKYAYWVLTGDGVDFESNGASIFMNDTYECESYESARVLNYFLDEVKNEALAIKYLEWLIFDSDTMDLPERQTLKPKFHTKLALLYLESIADEKDLSISRNYEKLFHFLESTNVYEPWTVLKSIPKDKNEYLRLTVFIYKRLGEHEKAIDVCFNQLNNLVLAIQYCSDVYSTDHLVGESLFHKLLEDLLLDPQENIDGIELLLNSQRSKMSVTRTLTVLPDSFPLHKVSNYLSENLGQTTKSLHDTRFISQLNKVGSITLRDELLTTQSKGYFIETGKQLCHICNKKLGYSVLAVHDNKVVHYGCLKNPSI